MFELVILTIFIPISYNSSVTLHYSGNLGWGFPFENPGPGPMIPWQVNGIMAVCLIYYGLYYFLIFRYAYKEAMRRHRLGESWTHILVETGIELQSDE